MHSIYSSPISHHTITHLVQVEPVFRVLFFILILKVFHRLVICSHSKICNSLLKEFYSSELINNYFSLCLHQKKNQLCDPSNNASYNVSECLFFRVVTLLVVILTHFVLHIGGWWIIFGTNEKKYSTMQQKIKTLRHFGRVMSLINHVNQCEVLSKI